MVLLLKLNISLREIMTECLFHFLLIMSWFRTYIRPNSLSYTETIIVKIPRFLDFHTTTIPKRSSIV